MIWLFAENEIHKNLNETLKNGIERARNDKKTIEKNESRPLSFDDPDYEMVSLSKLKIPPKLAWIILVLHSIGTTI